MFTRLSLSFLHPYLAPSMVRKHSKFLPLIGLFVCMSICLFVRLFVHLFIYLFVYLVGCCLSLSVHSYTGAKIHDGPGG